MFTQTIDIAQNLTRKVPKEKLYGLAVDTAVLFSDHKGVYGRRIEKHQRKLLAKLSFLAPFLEPGERILHVISGCSPATFVEQLLTGLLLQPLKRSLFAITNSAHTSRANNTQSAAPRVCCTNIICGLSPYSTEMGDSCRKTQERQNRKVPLHRQKRQKEGKRTAKGYAAQGGIKPDNGKSAFVPKVRKTAYKGLLRLPQLFPGI